MWVEGTEHETSAVERFEGLYGSIEAAAFWGAVVFPVGYVPFLTGGIGSTEQAVTFGALVVLHFLLLTVGHTYER